MDMRPARKEPQNVVGADAISLVQRIRGPMSEEEDIRFVVIAKFHLSYFSNPTIETPRALRPRGLRPNFLRPISLRVPSPTAHALGESLGFQLGLIKRPLRVQGARGSAESSSSRFPQTHPDGEIGLQLRAASYCGESRLCLSDPST